MTTVTAVTMKVENPDGSTQSWATTLSGVSTTQLTATYSFTGTTPFLTPGTYRVHAELSVPGGTLLSEEAEIHVLALHES